MGNIGSDGRPFSAEEQEWLSLALLDLLCELPQHRPEDFSTPQLCQWHSVLAASLERMQPGQLRQSDITFGSYFGTAPAKIAAELSELGDWHRQHWPTLETADEVLTHATRLHAELIRIHPFWDGNGRLARAVQAWLCWQGGLDAPQYENRTAYIAALNRYHHTRDLSLLLEVTRTAVSRQDLE